jgi:hypothetical protein
VEGDAALAISVLDEGSLAAGVAVDARPACHGNGFGADPGVVSNCVAICPPGSEKVMLQLKTGGFMLSTVQTPPS